MSLYLIDPVFENIEAEISWSAGFTSIYENIARACGETAAERPADGREPDLALASLLRSLDLPREGLLFDCRVGEVMSWPSPSYRLMHRASLHTYQPFVFSHLGGVEFAHALAMAEAMAGSSELPASVCTLTFIDAADLGRKVPVSSGIGCVRLSAAIPSASGTVWRLDACELDGGGKKLDAAAGNIDGGLRHLAASEKSGCDQLSIELDGAQGMRARVAISRIQ